MRWAENEGNRFSLNLFNHLRVYKAQVCWLFVCAYDMWLPDFGGGVPKVCLEKGSLNLRIRPSSFHSGLFVPPPPGAPGCTRF